MLCSIGDWFVLYQMSRNMNRYNTILKFFYYFLAVRFLRISEPVISEVFPDFLTSLISHGLYLLLPFFIVIATRFVPFYLNKNSYNLDKENKK